MSTKVMSYSEIQELADSALCWRCVGEAFLRDQIKKEGKRRQCRYCGKKRASFLLGEVADMVEAAFSDHFARTPSEPDAYQYAAMKDPESSYDWYREGEPTADAIMNAADIPGDASSDLQLILADRHYDFDAAAMGDQTEFDEDVHYEEIMPGDEQWQEGWRDLQRALKTEARFFSRTAEAQFRSIFDGIEAMQTKSGKPLIVVAGPDTELTELFRARVFQSPQKLRTALQRPDKDLAAPPPGLAASGRMNARGISAFYGATSHDVALAEVRPPVGAKVAVARFQIIRPLRLLDLNALGDLHESGSIFDPTYAHRLGRMTFLQSLGDRMARPVMPDDQETEYLPTQAVADYLAGQHTLKLDGIIFPSVQVGGDGTNVVLFQKASRCEELALPKGTTITTYQPYDDEDDEDDDRDFIVFEEVPPTPSEPDSKKDVGWPFSAALGGSWNEPLDSDYREPALRSDPAAVIVYSINSVHFKHSSYTVKRHRSVKGLDPF